MIEMNTHEKLVYKKYQQLKTILRNLGKVMVAFSGGVDSTFLLKTLSDLVSRRYMAAVTAVSATMALQEYEDAMASAKSLGVRHILVETRELDIPGFVSNPPDKCYICKKHRFGMMVTMAREKGYDCVVDGENLDDRLDYRPGTIAAKELGIRSPLREAGLTKQDIRQLSREMGLQSWNKASFACLASRIPCYQAITREKLIQVDQAEMFLRKLGLSPQLRVRHYGDTAKIEADTKDLVKIIDQEIREQIIGYLKSLGFKFITVDLEGYRMGSLNVTASLQD